LRSLHRILSLMRRPLPVRNSWLFNRRAAILAVMIRSLFPGLSVAVRARDLA
jgi:hypothetical protein